MSDAAPIELAGMFLEWQRIEDAKAELSEQSKDLFKVAKDKGYDTKAMRAVFREKRVELEASPEDVAKAEEAEAMNELYRSALDRGLTARARPAHDARENIEEFPSENLSYSQSGLTYANEKGRGAGGRLIDAAREMRGMVGELTDTQESDQPDEADVPATAAVASDEKAAQDDVGATASSAYSPETANEVPAQDGGGTALDASHGDKSNAARPASVDAHVNGGRLAGEASVEAVTVVGDESGTLTNSHSQASSSRWRGVGGYEGLYEVSDVGEVRSIKTGRMLSAFRNEGGYLIVKLFKDNEGKNYKIHRLVASAFIRSPKDGEQVNHRDLDKENNGVSNLEWVSPKGNTNHFLNTPAGADWYEQNFKLTKEQVQEIQSLRGIQSIYKTAQDFGISKTHVSDIQNGKRHPGVGDNRADTAGESVPPPSRLTSPATNSEDPEIPDFLKRDEGRGYPKREAMEA